MAQDLWAFQRQFTLQSFIIDVDWASEHSTAAAAGAEATRQTSWLGFEFEEDHGWDVGEGFSAQLMK
jgi:hypothetical protein